MNPVLVFLIFVVAILIWFLLSFAFFPIGRFVHRIWKDAIDEMNKEDKKEKEKEE